MAKPDGKTNWSLRLARLGDADFLPDIERAAGQLFQGDPDLVDLDFDEVWEPDEHRALIAKGRCLTALCGDRIAGFLTAEPKKRELHIWEMSVHPDFQQRGIGAGLIRACQIDAGNAGFRAITLTTFRDFAWNAPFYERLGFAEITDLEAHPRLAKELAEEAEAGLPRERRCAMIHFIN